MTELIDEQIARLSRDTLLQPMVHMFAHRCNLLGVQHGRPLARPLERWFDDPILSPMLWWDSRPRDKGVCDKAFERFTELVHDNRYRVGCDMISDLARPEKKKDSSTKSGDGGPSDGPSDGGVHLLGAQLKLTVSMPDMALVRLAILVAMSCRVGWEVDDKACYDYMFGLDSSDEIPLFVDEFYMVWWHWAGWQPKGQLGRGLCSMYHRVQAIHDDKYTTTTAC